MNRIITVAFAIAFICGLHLACSQKGSSNDVWVHMGPDVHADLVYFFKKETTDDQIFEFDRTVTGVPDGNSGHSFLPGMESVVRVSINGYVGYALNFQPDATAEQKSLVKRRVSESPLVYKVYENVIPSGINTL